jgi:hypothetical protein
MNIKRNLNGSQKKEVWKNKALLMAAESSDGSSTAGTAGTRSEGFAVPVSEQQAQLMMHRCQ